MTKRIIKKSIPNENRDHKSKIEKNKENNYEEIKENNNRNILTLNNILEEKETESKKKVKNKLICKKKNITNANTNEMRIITIPRQRKSSVLKNWLELIKPIVTNLKLEIRMNKDKIEVRTCKLTEDKNNLQKSSDYIKAYLLGFSIEDALALLRIEDLYIESFQIQDVKILKGDHLSRCIGRICGSNGSTKYAIENATKTRIVIAGDKIHILGSYNNIKMARYSICSLILGSTQGKIFNKLNILAKRLKERF
ncbi:small subunit rRNA processing KH domain protein, putative [Plasmodium relictum]|uniref:Small subunit rRNA processing KH domain protein, putative n=1 Tax=Plasmodium relictum TaxID=85471 RepID=A0A1J1H9P2_PLARL|nr:small subunit rRNA processing KH domain protein, putative [Plasmodium relictum]CRH01231.1 small subunit rRNA processing KH domain protein, putative [Plasmodium relictum]